MSDATPPVAPLSAPEPAPYASDPALPAKNGAGLAAMIAGFVALLFAIIPGLSFAAWLPAIFAIVFGIIGLVAKNKPHGKALVGLLVGAGAWLIAIVVSVAFIAAIGAGTPSSSNDTPDAPSTSTDEEEPAAVANYYDTNYGSFEAFTTSGTGDSVIALPAGVTAGVVTATHQGSSNFVLNVINAANEPTGDLLVNEIGNYSGTTIYGLLGFGDPGTNLQVSADGAWTVTISPVSSAPEFTLPASGTGDAVYLYNGDASAWTITHDGSSNFVVLQYADSSMPNLAVNEIGAYSGKVPMLAGPSVLHIGADGAWTVSE